MKYEHQFLSAFIAVSILTIFLILLGTASYAVGPSPDIFSTDSVPYGIHYADWLARAWQWSVGIPSNIHPFHNYTPDKCTIHQSGPVWFLPAVPEGKGTVTQSCTVPAGKAIAFDIESGECDFGVREIKTDQALVSCAGKGNLPQYITLQASIDGVPIPNLKQFRVQSNFFNLTIPPNNIYEADPGTYKAISSGYFIILKPLSSGEHIVKYADQINNPLERQYNHAKSVTYNLHISP